MTGSISPPSLGDVTGTGARPAESKADAELPTGVRPLSADDGGRRIAAEAWSTLVPLMAGRPHMLVSLDGGLSYRARGRRLIRTEPPPQPAAIPVYDHEGTTRLLVLDLDVGRSSVDRVLADCAMIERLINQAGGRAIVDRSPSGGHHIYLPIVHPLALGEARALVRAVAARAPSVDVTPMLNAVTGVIRPPGSMYKRGHGFQQLVTPLAIAYDVLRRPNPVEVIRRLRRELAAELLAQAADTGAIGASAGEVVPVGTLSDDFADAPWQQLPGGARALTPSFARIAETGVYDASRYHSPSEARQAVLCSAVAAGMRLADVARRLEQGWWPGLASFYARYADRHRRKALLRDWSRADAYVRQQRARRRPNHNARQCDTRGQETQRGAGAAPGATTRRSGGGVGRSTEYQLIRMWMAGVDLEAGERYTPAMQMVLRSVAEMAQRTGSTRVRVGCRSLSVAAGRDHHAGVARQLAMLRQEDDPVLVLVEHHQGVLADEYELRIPDRWADLVERRPWRRGRIHGLRPAFRALGPVAALAYDALEHVAEPVSGRELARILGRSPTAVQEALDVLAGWDLVRRDRGRWHRSPDGDLDAVAEALGVVDCVRAQLARIRVEREAWWQWLGVRHLELRRGAVATADAIAERYTRPPIGRPPPEPPAELGPDESWWEANRRPGVRTDPDYTLLQLVEQVLGARLVRSEPVA